MDTSSKQNPHLSIETELSSLSDWFATPLGQYLYQRERAYFDTVIANIFGFHALQIGLPACAFMQASRITHCATLDVVEPADLAADPLYLPFAENSMDLVLLPHALEFSDDPHALLREVYRVIRPEGHLVLSGFNPFSLWGAKRYFGREQTAPWIGNFIALYRLKDWLTLLGFDVIGGKLNCYVPPLKQQRWLQRFAFFEAAGDRWWPIGGGVYFLRATKKVIGMRVITPAWQSKRKKALATAVRPMRETVEAE